jgi:D-alanine--poly(phosphoribitol) ligase subunit 1
VGAGDVVAIWADRTPDTVAVMLATAMLRAAYVPLDPANPPARNERILRTAGPQVLAYGPGTAVPPPNVDGVAALDLGAVGPEPGREPTEPARPDDVAYIMFTSGSTGSPEGVLVEHRSLVNYTAWCADTLWRPGTGTALFGSLGYDHALTALWPTLIRGERLRLVSGFWDTARVLDPSGEPFSLLKVTPSHLRFFERTARPSYAAVTSALVIGGEPLATDLVVQLADRLRGVRLVNHYGPTEATVACCYHEFTIDAPAALPTIPIGRPVWNTRVYLVDDDGRPVGAGRPAELVVAGAGVARGYLGGDREGRFVDESSVGGRPGRAYRTGDIVELLPDGNLLFLGRRDDQLKISGHRVELGELRRHALAAPGVADVAFHVERSEVDTVEAFVVPVADDADARRLAQGVREAMAAYLPAGVTPQRIHVVSELVINVNGKCDVPATRDRLVTGGGR